MLSTADLTDARKRVALRNAAICGKRLSRPENPNGTSFSA